MRKLCVLLFSFSCLLSIGQLERRDITVKKTMKLMGTRFEITVVAPNEEIGYLDIDEAVSEIERIEKIISSWDPNSETSKINQNAGIKPVKVSPELYGLIERSIKISEITDGAFDISYASMDNIWKFDGSMDSIPSEKAIQSSITKIGYQKILLNPDERSVFLKDPGMRISFGAIGKGYAADRAKELLSSKGVKGGIINASGDLTTWGTKVTGEKWLVGIANPLSKDKVFSWMPIIESSVATSGNYEKFIMFKGKKYSHIIDPRTGYPTTGINSVSIFAKQAELCDALATAVFIMGKDSGIHMINQIDGVEAVVVDSNNKIHKSSGIIFDTNP
ncbi:FAD:protein FMN transferase [Flagellimonas alvinocaridis]|uniref:FAD:protein FMN transferase n=1 Tax=Flagellimonas alvinocaridis TaxID=2530200 RepID=A0A4S8RSQ2_9FLAO|nr:FAD:protein FMN transferase [Allomuricauda alvinocaridis]THV60175.1 FAD:protein FMN transferase [Allomuricauda alvinocaridis]